MPWLACSTLLLLPALSFANDETTGSLQTEGWIALFVMFLVLAIAVFLTIWHKYQDARSEHLELETAYRSLEKQMGDRTQKLRAINNKLYGEIAQHEITEDKLRQAQTYLHSIINSMPSILIGVTPDGKITHWNSSAETTTGHMEDDVLGNYLWDVYPHLPVDLHMIQEAINQKTVKVKESSKYIHEGETYYNDITVYPLSTENLLEAVIRVDDVTMRVLMESMMIQNEKMMSLGELAAGMAHEINNPLGAILQSVQNIERRTSAELLKNQAIAEKFGTTMDIIENYLAEREINKFLANIRDAGERSAKIVSNMLEFSHSSQTRNQVDINELTAHCLELAENKLQIVENDVKVTIQINTDFADDLPLLSCSPAEIQQVLLNLLRNASQALEQRPDFSVPPIISLHTSLQSENIVIKVSDNGPGIPEEIRRHIFEPFYTTKEVGQGTGLGLSISYFIITEHHGGSIEVNSTVGKGTEFVVRLPLYPEPK